MFMRKIFTAIIIVSAPLVLAACGEKAVEPEETIVAEETVIEEPPVDATASEAQNAVDATADVSKPAPTSGISEATERGSDEK